MGNLKLLAGILIIFSVVASSASASDEVTREGITEQVSEGDSISLNLKGVECIVEINKIAVNSIELNLCDNDIILDRNVQTKIDIDNDYINDVIATYKYVPGGKSILEFKLVYDITTKLTQKPIVQQETVQAEPEKVIDENKVEAVEQEKVADESKSEEIDETDVAEDNQTKETIKNPEDEKEKIISLLKKESSTDIGKEKVVSFENETKKDIPESLKSLFNYIKSIPYIEYIAAGLVILIILLAVLHFSLDKSKKNNSKKKNKRKSRK